MSNIRIKLLTIINKESLDSVNYIIAQYILENLTKMRHLSNTELAHECNVSKASISRFCKKLGYDDYFNLQIEIASYNARDHKGNQDNDKIQNYLLDVVDSSAALMDNLDSETLKELVTDIKNYDRVVLMGQVQSSLPAFSLQHNLTLTGKYVYCTQDLEEHRSMLNKLRQDTLVIVFSSGGKFFDRVLNVERYLKGKDIPKIYFITANESEHYPFIHKNIELLHEYNHTSNILLNMYSDLIYFEYKNIL